MRKIKQCLTLTLMTLMLGAAAVAEPWAGNGLNWSHSSGWSINIPANADSTTETSADDDISIHGKTLDYSVNLRCYNNQAQAEQFEAALADAMKDANPQLKGKEKVDGPEWSIVGREGTATNKGQSMEVSIGHYYKGNKFLVFFTLLDSKNSKQLNDVVGEIMSNVHLK